MSNELLFDLLACSSPSGGEQKIKNYIASYLEEMGIQAKDLGPAGLSWEIGQGESLAFFSAHADHVGFVVERVDDEGYIYLSMPGIDHRLVPCQEMKVWGKKELRGVVGMPPPHITPAEERKFPVPSEKLFLDVGLSADEVKSLVSVGTLCTWAVEPVSLQDSYVSGVGLDNRLCVFLELLLTRKLSKASLPGRLRFFASAQEEGVMLGAGFAGRSAVLAGEDVSFAVVADATFGTDPYSKDEGFPLGKGPTLGVGPILSHKHLAVLRSIASEREINYWLEPLSRSTGTEADVISIAGKGIPCILVSIPLRYMHSPVEVANMDDVETTLELLEAALLREELWNC